MNNADFGVDPMSFTDFNTLSYRPQYAADALRISPQTLKQAEKDYSLDIKRTPRGSVSHRMYSLADIFEIAAKRRERGMTKGLGRSVVISTYVQKGGTAKTTTTCNFAIECALAGLRTLIIDNDPQGDVSSMLGYDPDLTPEELIELGLPPDRAVDGHIGNLMGIGNMYQPKTLAEVIKKPFGEHGPHLIPAENSLDDLDIGLRNAQGSDFRYGVFFEKARSGSMKNCDFSNYDVIIMDNAPSGTMLSRNSMSAADFLVCPIRMDKFSFRALSRLAQKLHELREDWSRNPEMIAIPTMYIRNRPRIAANLSKLVNLFPGKVTENPLYLSEDYSKSLEEGIPISIWPAASVNSGGAMRNVFDEVLGRIRAVVEASK